jgi:predicted enzyme related to lactoylglutathione lyase
MKRVTGIGGIFFTCSQPNETKNWYKTHLGLNTDRYGTAFEWRQTEQPERKGFTQWSPMDSETNYFEPGKQEFMLNFRVENLELLVEELRRENIIICDEIESFEYGKFVHILDYDGRKIELWEPQDDIYDQLTDGRTK